MGWAVDIYSYYDVVAEHFLFFFYSFLMLLIYINTIFYLFLSYNYLPAEIILIRNVAHY